MAENLKNTPVLQLALCRVLDRKMPRNMLAVGELCAYVIVTRSMTMYFQQLLALVLRSARLFVLRLSVIHYKRACEL